MVPPHLHAAPTVSPRGGEPGTARPIFRHVMACIDHSVDARRVLQQAATIAELSGAELTALRVLPTVRDERYADPVEWELSRREENAYLRRVARDLDAPETMKTAIMTGCQAARCILDAARESGADLVVLGAGARENPRGWGLGGTARHVAEDFDRSVLIVPEGPWETRPADALPRRILVPLDGSARAEAALRIAAAIAPKRSAELVLVHAVPQIELHTEGPEAPEDEALRDRLTRRAEHIAKTRLDRLRRLLPADTIRSRVRMLSGEEPRRALARTLLEEEGELVVLAARGTGSDPDLPIGSTADYLLSHAASPVLLVRSAEPMSHRTAGSAPRRRPTVRGGS